ncbi:MAG: transposase [Deltaproteobacteria bacterium]|nr:transposase [Deltaproteobacteria bacterium]
MPRVARLDAAGILHHVIIRGIEKKSIFRSSADKDWFVQRLGLLLQASSTSCYAWVLMKNHVHLLVRTGDVSLATFMRRLLTGYAGYFNRRYNRHGQLFQNRYKSIICQEDVYLKELVRYIHLNPLRAGIVKTLEGLQQYGYSGHSPLMGKRRCSWQQTGYVLELFGKRVQGARQKYSQYVEQGIELGRRPELVGGGLIRSMGGWEAVKKLRVTGQERVKGDVRILGEGEFVQQVLARAEERFTRQHELKRRGYDMEKVEKRAAEAVGIAAKEIRKQGREKQRVEARSLAIYWAVRELGIDGMTLARRYGLTQSAIVYAARRGEKTAKELNCQLLI